MKTNNQLLAVAVKQLGNNGSKYRKYAGYGGSWCNMFVYWLFNANGCGTLFPMKTQYQKTYCPTSIKWCNANLAMIPAYLVMPCDIIYFDWDKNGKPNHIGIVEKRESTSVIHTIEGNTSGGIVARKKREVKYVQGVYRPHFVPTGLKKQKLDEDGAFEYKSVYMLQVALGLKPTGILDKATVSALQRKAGSGVDGAWGAKTSRAVQKMVGLTGKANDSLFGKQSVIALQKWINKVCGYNKPVNHESTKPTPKPAPKPTPTTATYTGAFPNLVVHSGQKIAYTARDLAYAKGTSKSVYTYPKGKAKASFTNAINKVYPKRSSWSKQCQKGASCDVGAGTIIRYSGVDTKVPRGLQEQLDHFKKSSLWKNTGLKKCSLAGDVAMQPSPSAHIWIGLGNGDIAEANHTWKFYEHVVKDTRKINGKPKSAVYRCTKASVIKKGDRGTEVLKLQNFLNWAGFNCGKPDGVFGDATFKATKAFQTKVGLAPDGEFGNGSLTKAKAYKK